MQRFLVVIERAGANYSAYCPDLPGRVPTGDTREETERNMREALQLHVEGMVEDGEPIPEPSALAEYMSVA
jgi:predicted RNase H-like HicB family nuclease